MDNDNTIKVLIVDDQELIRFAIKAILNMTTGFKLIGEAQSGENALQMVKDLQPDVILLDISMPGWGGIVTLSKLLSHYPDIKVIGLSSYDNDPYPSRFMESGGRGFLSKGCKPEELYEAIKTVYVGETYISPLVAQHIATNKFISNNCPFNLLTHREFEIVELIITGEAIKNIATKLCISIKTVNEYRRRIHEKLKVSTDRELMLLAMNFGLIKKINK